MINITPTNLRKDLFGMLEQVIKNNEQINVSSKNGNVIIINKRDYDDLMATMEIYRNPQLKADIIEGLNTPLEEMIPESEVEW